MSAAPTKRYSLSHTWAIVTFVVLVASIPVLASQWGRLRFGAEIHLATSPSVAPAADREILLTWAGSSLGDPRLTELLALLEPIRDASGVARGGLPHVASVAEPRRLLLALQDNGVAPTDAVLRLQGDLVGSGPLRLALSDSAQARLKHVRTELFERARRELGLTLTLVAADAELSSTARIPVRDQDSGNSPASMAPIVLSPAGELLAAADLEHQLAIQTAGLRPGTPEARRLAEWLLSQPLDAEASSPKMVARVFFVPGSPVGVRIELSDAGLADPAEAVARIRAVAGNVGIAEADLRLAGTPVLASALAEEARLAVVGSSVSWTHWYEKWPLGSAVLVAMLLAGLLTGDVRRSIAVVTPAALSVLGAAAIAAVLQVPVTLMVLAVPTIVAIASLGMSGWIVARTVKSPEPAAERRVQESLEILLRPTLCLAALLSCVGLSFGIVGLPEQRDAGLVLAGAAPLMWLFATFGTASLLILLQAPGDASDVPAATVALPTRSRSGRPVWGLVAAVTVCIALAAFGLSERRWDSSLVTLLGPAHPVRENLASMNLELHGTRGAELFVRFSDTAQEASNLIDRLEMVRAIETELRKQADVTGVFSLADFHPVIEPPQDDSFRATTRYQKQASDLAQRIQDDQTTFANTWLGLITPQERSAWADVLAGVSAGDEVWRIRILLDGHSGAALQSQLEMINRVAREFLRLQAGAAHQVAGPLADDVRRQGLLEAGFWLALVLTATLGAGGMVLGLRSIRVGAAAVAIVLLPLAGMLGASLLAGAVIGPVLPFAAACGIGLAALFVMPGCLDGARRRAPWGAAAIARVLALALVVGGCGGVLCKSTQPLLGQLGLVLLAVSGCGCLTGLILSPLLMASRLGATLLHDPGATGDAEVLAGSLGSATIDETPRPSTPVLRRNAG